MAFDTRLGRSDTGVTLLKKIMSICVECLIPEPPIKIE